MSNQILPKVKLTTIAEFSPGHFLENLAVRADNSVLLTALNHKQLWYVPTYGMEPAGPLLLHTFDQLTLSFTEVEPDVFYLCTSNIYTDHRSSLHRVDLRNWTVGNPIQPQKVLDFPDRARALNGSCLIGHRTILVADSMAGLIWRVDLPNDGAPPVASVWLQHESMGYYPGAMKPEQPASTAFSTHRSLATSTTRRQLRSCSCVYGSIPRRWIQSASWSMSRPGAWQTISASTKTPVLLT